MTRWRTLGMRQRRTAPHSWHLILLTHNLGKRWRICSCSTEQLPPKRLATRYCIRGAVLNLNIPEFWEGSGMLQGRLAMWLEMPYWAKGIWLRFPAPKLICRQKQQAEKRKESEQSGKSRKRLRRLTQKQRFQPSKLARSTPNRKQRT